MLKTTWQKRKHFEEMFVRTLHYHQLTQNKGKESKNSYQKLKRIRWTGTRTHMETKSKYFDGYGHPQSEENECM